MGTCAADLLSLSYLREEFFSSNTVLKKGITLRMTESMEIVCDPIQTSQINLNSHLHKDIFGGMVLFWLLTLVNLKQEEHTSLPFHVSK